MHRLRLAKSDTPQYKYYTHFCTNKGCYEIWSRDSKRYYIDGGRNATLLMLPDTPFKKPSEAIKYLKRRLAQKGNFDIKGR